MVNSKKTAKSTTKAALPFEIPAAPWIYINDNSPESYVTHDLIKLIPNSFLATSSYQQERFEYPRTESENTLSYVNVFQNTKGRGGFVSEKDELEDVKTNALKTGANFVSIHVSDGQSQHSGIIDTSNHGTPNHLDIAASSSAGKAIYDWLFTVLTVCETLYLIPDAKMREIDTELFPEYKYCAISDSRSAPKDAKIQFVALVVTKPQVVAGKKVVWTVVDKTGAANFYFQHRGESSQYTWDWVMSLKPGDRKALPRMPMVQIKERRRIRVVKAPFRAVAAVVGGTGFVFKQIGKSISNAGKGLKMGQSSQWVPEADVDASGKKIDWAQKERKEARVDRKAVKKPAKIIDETDEKLWDDAASDASTEAGVETTDEKFKDLS